MKPLLTTQTRSCRSLVPAKFVSRPRTCHHTLHTRNQAGQCVGTWVEQRGPYGTRVSCKYCGKLYGYSPLAIDRSDEQALEAYLLQRSQDSKTP